MVVGSIAEIEKVRIARVRAQHLVRVFDRAEVLLGSGGNLARIGQQAAGVRAIQTVEFFEDVEVGQMLMVEHDIV